MLHFFLWERMPLFLFSVSCSQKQWLHLGNSYSIKGSSKLEDIVPLSNSYPSSSFLYKTPHSGLFTQSSPSSSCYSTYLESLYPAQNLQIVPVMLNTCITRKQENWKINFNKLYLPCLWYLLIVLMCDQQKRASQSYILEGQPDSWDLRLEASEVPLMETAMNHR